MVVMLGYQYFVPDMWQATPSTKTTVGSMLDKFHNLGIAAFSCYSQHHGFVFYTYEGQLISPFVWKGLLNSRYSEIWNILEEGALPAMLEHLRAVLDVAESGRRLSGAACATRGPTGRMQISAELVPIPDTSGYFRMRRDFEFRQNILLVSYSFSSSIFIFCFSDFQTKFGEFRGKSSKISAPAPEKNKWRKLANFEQFSKQNFEIFSRGCFGPAFFFPRSFRLRIPKRCKGVYYTFH